RFRRPDPQGTRSVGPDGGLRSPDEGKEGQRLGSDCARLQILSSRALSGVLRRGNGHWNPGDRLLAAGLGDPVADPAGAGRGRLRGAGGADALAAGCHRDAVATDLRDPRTAFQAFTFVAGTGVLASALAV